MDYFLKASAIIVLFYTCYKLFLQRETYFQSNRWFLLIGLFLATILPLVVIPIYIEYTPTPITFSETTSFGPQQIEPTYSIDLWVIVFVGYLIGTLVFFGKVILQFLSLSKLFKKHSKIKQDQFIFIETEDNIAPFSFFNRIVFNANQFTTKELDHIITHEKIHAKQFHSIDVILIQIATILFWFNPFIWWYKKALHQNLEFIADYEAQNKIACSKSYQTVLLKASLNQNQLALPTNFYQSLIKKRIIMLQKSKSKNSSYFKLAIVLPFLALFLMSFNIEEVYVPTTETVQNELKTEVFIISSKSSDKEIEAIKNRLEVQTDGLKIRFTDIKRNSNGEIINLSIETKLKGKTSFNHNVTYQSKSKKPIDNIALKIENGELVFGDEKQEMVMRVTNKGVVAESITKKETQNISNVGTIHMQNSGDTIKLEIDSDDKKDNSFTYKIETEETGDKKSKLIFTETNKSPLYIINGKVYDNITIDNMDTENIESVNVLKGKSAIKKYGETGENGVVEIITKSSTNYWVIDKNDKQEKKSDSVYIITKSIKFTDSFSPKKVIIKHPNGNTNSIQTSYFNSVFSNDSTIIIINGKKVDNSELKKLNPDNIKSMNVLKGNSAKQVYGSVLGTGSVNRVIEIKTKDKNTSKWIIKNTDSTRTNNSNRFTYRVDTTFEDENTTKSSVLFTLPKTATDKSIEKNIKFMKNEYGLDVKINKLKRNKAGEIVKIKIAIEDDKGQKASATYQSNDGIPTVRYGSNMDGNLFISSEK